MMSDRRASFADSIAARRPAPAIRAAIRRASHWSSLSARASVFSSPAAGALAKGIQSLVSAIKGMDAYQAGVMELGRDFGGIRMSRYDLEFSSLALGAIPARAMKPKAHASAAQDLCASQWLARISHMAARPSCRNCPWPPGS